MKLILCFFGTCYLVACSSSEVKIQPQKAEVPKGSTKLIRTMQFHQNLSLRDSLNMIYIDSLANNAGLNDNQYIRNKDTVGIHKGLKTHFSYKAYSNEKTTPIYRIDVLGVNSKDSTLYTYYYSQGNVVKMHCEFHNDYDPFQFNIYYLTNKMIYPTEIRKQSAEELRNQSRLLQSSFSTNR